MLVLLKDTEYIPPRPLLRQIKHGSLAVMSVASPQIINIFRLIAENWPHDRVPGQ